AGGAWRWSRLLLPGVGVPGGFAGVEEGLVGAGLGGDEGFLVDGVAEACHLLAVVAELFATRADVAAVVAPVAVAGAYGGDGDAACGEGEAGTVGEDLVAGPVGDGVAAAGRVLAAVAELFATRAYVAAGVAPVAEAGASCGDGDAACGEGEAGPVEEDLVDGPVGDGVEGLAGGEVKGEVVDHGFS